MKRLVPIQIAVFLAASTALAQGVPAELSFTGNLTNSGMPETGTHTFIFRLFDASSGGTQAWTETQNLNINNGKVFATLGSTTAFTPAILNGATLYLEVTIDGTTLSPRSPVVSVPYAVRAGTANTAETLGSLTPGSVQQRISSTCAGANAIQTISVNGTVTCVPIPGGDITGVLAGAGLTGGATAGDAPLSLITCAAGQVLKAGAGGTWACASDNDTNTTYTNQAPISLSGTTFGLTNCGANQVYKMNAGGTAWACAADVDTDTGATAFVNGGGVTLSYAPATRTLTAGSDLNVLQARVAGACGAGSNIRSIASNGAVTCQADQGLALGSCTWARTTSSTSTTIVDATCPAGKFPISGGCDASGSATVAFTRPYGPPADGTPVTGLGTQAWRCQFSAAAMGHVALALCCEVD